MASPRCAALASAARGHTPPRAGPLLRRAGQEKAQPPDGPWRCRRHTCASAHTRAPGATAAPRRAGCTAFARGYRSVVGKAARAVVDHGRKGVGARAVKVACPRAVDNVCHVEVGEEVPVARLRRGRNVEPPVQDLRARGPVSAARTSKNQARTKRARARVRRRTTRPPHATLRTRHRRCARSDACEATRRQRCPRPRTRQTSAGRVLMGSEIWMPHLGPLLGTFVDRARCLRHSAARASTRSASTPHVAMRPAQAVGARKRSAGRMYSK